MPPWIPLQHLGSSGRAIPLGFFGAWWAVSHHCPPLTSKILGPDHFWKRNYWCFPHQTMNNYPKWSCLAKKYHHFIVSHQNAGRHNSHVWIFMDIFLGKLCFIHFCSIFFRGFYTVLFIVFHGFSPWLSMVLTGLSMFFFPYFFMVSIYFESPSHGAPLQLDIEFEIPSFTSQAPALAWRRSSSQLSFVNVCCFSDDSINSI